MHHIELSGEWMLSLAAGQAPVPIDHVPATIPGDNLTALFQAGLIPDPFVARNEIDLQWLGRCDWEFHRTFEIPEHYSGSLRLVAQSIDTVAELWVNDSRVCESDNMFFPVDVCIPPDAVRSGTNTIRVVIAGAERIATERAQALEMDIPHTQFPVQSPHRNLVRKVQCHAGWDWGPALMVSGIYGNIGLYFSEAPFLSGFAAQPTRAGGQWRVAIESFFAPPDDPLAAAPRVEVEVEIRDPSNRTVATTKEPVRIWPDGHGEVIETHLSDPDLWWPNDMGAQTLYTVSMTAGGRTLEKRIGFREVTLQRLPDDEGESFTFVVNGQPIFAKGSNWIPQDALPGRSDPQKLRRLLESAAESHQNMIRVWGGGTYESDQFYDICDELGLLVWQDFMFACGMYPDADWFLESVRKEVQYQVRRLKDRACLALWCGNNENVGALNWYEQSKTKRDRYLVAYDRLNEGVVGTTCRENDSGHAFWPSSPAAGVDDFGDDWEADQAGDMHYWAVWHGGKPFAAYRSVTPRFCSEFGFQSFSSASEVATFATPDQYNVTSPVMEHHQRNDRGNALIMLTMNRYYRFPNGFVEQLYLSQVQQAHAIRTAVEYWRSRMPRCMGAIYWQLNDTWPVASWASLEYSGKWKLLHYAAARFFAPQAVVAVPLDAGERPLTKEQAPAAAWAVCVINDLPKELSGTLVVRIMGYDGTVLHSKRLNGALAAPSSATHIHTVRVATGPDPSAAFAVVDFEPQGESLSRSRGALRTQFFLHHPKQSELAAATVAADVIPEPEGFLVRLSTDLPAFEVSLDAGSLPGRFSDNMIPLLPGEPVEIHWIANQPVDKLIFADTLRIVHLNQIGVFHEG